MAITILVGQALRDGLKTKEQISAFVIQLRAGEFELEDEKGEGRDKSLGASLSYGFEHAFSAAERAQLALLHLFQSFVDVDALTWMGSTGEEYCLPEVGSLTRSAGKTLLDRAAEIGLLTADGDGFYTIHSALPWYFKNLFRRLYKGRELEATLAFAETVGKFGGNYFRQYNEGNRGIITVLAAQEANLLHARRLARMHGRRNAVIGTMQGVHSRDVTPESVLLQAASSQW